MSYIINLLKFWKLLLKKKDVLDNCSSHLLWIDEMYKKRLRRKKKEYGHLLLLFIFSLWHEHEFSFSKNLKNGE